MIQKNENKYRIEKVLHELIRDLPEVRKVSDRFDHGMLTAEDALEEIAFHVKQYKQ